MREKVNHPKHYNKGKIEVIDAIADWKLEFCAGNVVKYVARHKYKGSPIEDLKKARWYLEYEILRLENEKKDQETDDELKNSLSIFNKGVRIERG